MALPCRPCANGWDAIWPVVRPALADASSRPARSPRAIDAAKVLLIVGLHQRRMLQRQLARSIGVRASTVSRVLARAACQSMRG